MWWWRLHLPIPIWVHVQICPVGVAWLDKTARHTIAVRIRERCLPACCRSGVASGSLWVTRKGALTLAESDQLIVAKLSAAISAGLTPLLCVGESLTVRESGQEEAAVRAQLQAALSDIPPASLLIAYEPIWAIGTGVTASPEQADAMHAVIRNELTGLMDDGASVPLLYGGSVNPDNAGALFDCPHVDGALVGGASLDGTSFSEIVEAAQASLRQ